MPTTINTIEDNGIRFYSHDPLGDGISGGRLGSWEAFPRFETTINAGSNTIYREIFNPRVDLGARVTISGADEANALDDSWSTPIYISAEDIISDICSDIGISKDNFKLKEEEEPDIKPVSDSFEELFL